MRRATRVRSVPFWHAVRLTAAALAGTVLFRVTNPEDGFWIPEAALFIMRPEPSSRDGGPCCGSSGAWPGPP